MIDTGVHHSLLLLPFAAAHMLNPNSLPSRNLGPRLQRGTH